MNIYFSQFPSVIVNQCQLILVKLHLNYILQGKFNANTAFCYNKRQLISYTNESALSFLTSTEKEFLILGMF